MNSSEQHNKDHDKSQHEGPGSDPQLEKQLEEAESQVRRYRFGQGVEKDLCEAVEWQKKYCDLLAPRYPDVCDDSICVLIKAEYDLAEMELELGRISAARNACWRGIPLCRNRKGDFYSFSRIPHYTKLYMLLGDVFLSRSDERQAIECYAKVLSVCLEMEEELYHMDKEEEDFYAILMDAARCLFKLCEIYDQFDGRIYCESILFCLRSVGRGAVLETSLCVRYDAELSLIEAKCCKLLGDYHARSEEEKYYEQSARRCASLISGHKTAEAYSVLVDVYLSLSRLGVARNQDKEAESYVQKAYDVCRENIRLNKSAAGYVDLLGCIFQSVEIVRRNDSENSRNQLPPGAFARISELEKEARDVMSVLEKEYPGPKTDFLAFKTLSVFYEFNTMEDIIDVYRKALDAVRSKPITYYREYRKIKHALWALGKINWAAYRDYIIFEVTGGTDTNCLRAWNTTEMINLYVVVFGNLPEPVYRIMVPEDEVFGMRYENAMNPDQWIDSRMQICKPDSGLRGDRDMNIPLDEYVYLSTEQNRRREPNWLTYVQCYG